MRIAMLWTGGKDSAVALYRLAERGENVVALVTFVPDAGSDFHAHPLEKMQAQARSLNLPHRTFGVSEPYREGYIAALRRIKEDLSVEAVGTGDIDYVDGLPNWIKECSDAVDLKSVFPIWHIDREGLLREVIRRGIEADVSWIKPGALPAAWLGRRIDDAFIRDILDLRKSTGIDICGENGEYHTMCMSLPTLPSAPNSSLA